MNPRWRNRDRDRVYFRYGKSVKLLSLSAPFDPEACTVDWLVPVEYPPTGIGSKLSQYMKGFRKQSIKYDFNNSVN